MSYQNVSWRNIQLIFGPPAVAWRVLWNSVCLSFCQSFCLAGTFTWNCFIVFSKFWHGARNLYGILCDKAWFSWKKKNLLQKLSKWTKNVPKTGFFEFIEKFGQSFLLSLFCNEDLFYLLCSCTNPLFGKIYCSWDMGQNILSESDCKIF